MTRKDLDKLRVGHAVSDRKTGRIFYVAGIEQDTSNLNEANTKIYDKQGHVYSYKQLTANFVAAG